MQPLEAKALSRLAQLHKARREPKRVTWPGSTLECRLRVLSCTEVQECAAAATVRFADLKLDPDAPRNLSLFEDEVCTQILLRACRDVDHPEMPFAVDADDLRDNTTVDERATVFLLYQDYQNECDPSPADVPLDVFRAIEEAIKKKDRARLLAFGSAMLASYMLGTGGPSSS